ncbi:NFACT family protein [uncultured Phascolarctobacterium sp.]|uniref:Rqc2 family fibronectin-binding protein n=1 Tax=Phascolarctobacterium sp. TaxID=2049039 RepID=UPI0025D76C68|nr:NFACT family protein [uncultured Phascolarctobacterium sp.]
MNLEGLTLHILTNKLQQELLGGKIYKVFMPSYESLLLLIKRERDTVALLADLSSGSPMLYLPDKLPERPEVPPAFCMLLRKHLEEGRITRIEQSGLDRIITIDIDTIGAARQIVTKQLIFELTGKNSNIIFAENGIIADSLKHVNKAMSSFRQIMPNIPYVAPPPQTGLAILTADANAIIDAMRDIDAKTRLAALISVTTGIGKMTAAQLFAAASIDSGVAVLTPDEEQRLVAAISALQQLLTAQQANQQPVYALVSRTNQVKTIFAFEPQTLDDGCTVKKMDNINSALNYAVTLTPIQLPEQEMLQKLVTNEVQRLEKKLPVLADDLKNADNAEMQRMIADTIMANIYQISKGQSSCQLVNIYDGTPLEVTLSPLLTPTENAQAYYKRYNKYKRAQSEVQHQIETTQEMLAYLASIEASLTTATLKNEIAEIKQELISAGLLQAPTKKNKGQSPKSEPLVVKLSEDTTLYIGKNNKQNDYVTFDLGRGKDLWFHTKNIPGSHVILKTSLPQASADAIDTAVMLAAYFSKSRYGSKVPVDCTERRFVKKPNGAKPGFVIYTDQTTYYATPDEEEVQKLLHK